MLLGMLALALPGAGCATLSHLGLQSTDAAAKTTPPIAAMPGSNVDFATYMAQAQQARVSGDTATAIKLLSQLVLVAPDDPHILGEYGKALAAANHSDDAIAFLQRAIQLEPGNWTLYSAQGVAYDQKGQFQQAQLAYARALELKPGEASVLNNDALSHMQAGDLAGAEILLRQISPKSPGYDRVVKNLALVQSLKPPVMPPQANMQTAKNNPPANKPPVQSDGAPKQLATARPSIMLPSENDAQPSSRQMASVEPAMMPPAQQDFQLFSSEPVTAPPNPSGESMPAATPPATSAPRQLTGIDALRADPSVVVGPLPKEEEPKPTPASVTKPPMPDRETKPQSPAKTRVADASQGAAGRHVYVQAGAYFSEARARQAATGLEAMDVKIMTGTVNGREVFRVRIGPFTTAAQAKAAFAQVQALGHSDLIIVRE